MSRKRIYKMSIKILELCVILVSTFREFVEFSLSSAIVKITVTNKTLVKQIVRRKLFAAIKTTKTTGTKRCDLKMPKIFGLITYIIVTRNLTHYPKYQIYTLN